MPLHSPAPNVGRFTGIVLGLVVFICVTMIGGTGYLKYQLDRSESVLAAPDAVLGTDQDLFDKLRRDLGYGGFLGLAQRYALAHDASGFADMKADIKSADDIMTHLPDQTPAETRHELASIVSTFDAALQKISAPANEVNSEFTPSDLAPLYAALPILDSRVASVNGDTRLSAQNHLQFWAMLLTLVSWCSLIIAAACAAGIYLTLRDKHSAPMRALAQSIANMARGDMRTAIWGTERQDMIGELARSVDVARYHFSHLPDLSLLSDQGPVRLRFEGGSRSLFEAMMQTISRDSENIREQTVTLTQTVSHQKDTLAQMSSKVDHVLQTILNHGQNGDQQIRLAIQEMVGSAENLKNAHAHAADQLNRLIPHLQDRAQGMAEIAQITGKQIGQTLQSLSASEAGLKANADQAKETMTRLFSTADDLGERLFGAINLLQASGKVLAETTQSIQGGMGGSINVAGLLAGQVDADAETARVREAAWVEPMSHHLDQITDQLFALQSKIDRYDDRGASDLDESQHSAQTIRAFTELLAQRIEPKLMALEHGLDQLFTKKDGGAPPLSPDIFAELGRKIAELTTSVPSELRGYIETNGDRLGSRMEALQAKMDEQKVVLLSQSESLSEKTRSLMDGLGDKIASLSSKAPPDLHPLRRELETLAARIDHHTLSLGERIETSSRVAQQTLADVSDTLTSLGTKLPAEIQRHAQHDWQSLMTRLNSLSSEIGLTVTGEMSPKLNAIEAAVTRKERDARGTDNDLEARRIRDNASLDGKLTKLQASVEAISLPDTFNLPPQILKQLDGHWYQMAAQIEASRASLDKALSEQVAHKLDALAQTLSETREALGRYEPAVPPTGSASSSSLPLAAELQKQLDGHWYQVAAQIEASRTSLIDTISEQIAKMERRTTSGAPDALSLSASDYSTQRQIEQQTQILSELVATLGVLDAHMQQIKTEIHATARS